jgi:hypothetical protein
MFVGYPLAVSEASWPRFARPFRASCCPRRRWRSTAGVVGIAAVLSAARYERLFWACGATALATAAASLRHHKTLARRVFELPHVRTERAYGASALRVALRTVRLTGASVAALAASDVPSMLTSALVAEHVFGLRGIGATTVAALRSGDQAWLLTVAVAGTLTVGVAQIAADLLLSPSTLACEPGRALPGRSMRARPTTVYSARAFSRSPCSASSPCSGSLFGALFSREPAIRVDGQGARNPRCGEHRDGRHSGVAAGAGAALGLVHRRLARSSDGIAEALPSFAVVVVRALSPASTSLAIAWCSPSCGVFRPRRPSAPSSCN